MIKGVFKKTLICILIFILMFNFCITSVTFAEPSGPEEQQTSEEPTIQTSAEEVEAQSNEKAEKVSTGLVGTIMSLIRGLIYLVVSGVNEIIGKVAISAGKTDTEDLSVFITPFDIIFNRFVLTDINVFSLDGLDPDGFVATIRKSIAMFFVVMTGISIGMLIIVLIVFIIQFGFESDVAERKAKIKQAFLDWLASLLAVILMDSIVILVITMNNLAVSAIRGASSTDIAASVAAMEDIIVSSETGVILGIGTLITYIMLTYQTGIFLVRYLARFFTVILLIVIAPLAPVPYALSKMKNRDSSTSLFRWLGEFVNAVCSQLIHCVVYVVLVQTAFKAIASNTEIKGVAALAPAIFAVFAMFFVSKAENIVRGLFSIQGTKGGFGRTIGGIVEGSRESGAIITNKTYTPLPERNGETSIIGGIMNQYNKHKKPGDEQDQSKIHYSRNKGLETPVMDDAHNPSDLEKVPKGEDGEIVEDGQDRPGTTDRLDTTIPDSRTENDAMDELESVVSKTSKLNGEDGVDGVDGADVVLASDTTRIEKSSTNEETEETVTEETVVAVPADEKRLQELKDYLSGRLKAESDRIIESVSKVKITDENREELEAKFKEIFEPIQNDIKKMLEESKGDREAFFNKVQEKYQNNAEHYDYAKAFAMNLAAESMQNGAKDTPKSETKDHEIDGNPIDEQAKERLAGINDATMNFLKQNIGGALSENPELRDQFIEIINKRNALVGKAEIESDTSDELLAEMSVDIIKSEKLSSMDNYNEALAKVKAEGDASMAALEEYMKNPTEASAAMLSDAGKVAAQFKTEAALNGLVVKAVHTSSSGTATANTETLLETNVHTPSESSAAVLDAINGSKQNTTEPGTDK